MYFFWTCAQRTSPLAASIARHLNAEGGNSVRAEVPPAVGEGHRVSINLAPADAGFTKFTWDGAQFVKSEVPKEDPAPGLRFEGRDHNKNSNDRGSVIMEGAAVSALVMLRPNVTSALQNERDRLRKVRIELQEPVEIIRRSLNEHTQRLKLVEQKVAEKARVHERALGHFRRARDAFNSAKLESATPAKEGHAAKSSL